MIEAAKRLLFPSPLLFLRLTLDIPILLHRLPTTPPLTSYVTGREGKNTSWERDDACKEGKFLVGHKGHHHHQRYHRWPLDAGKKGADGLSARRGYLCSVFLLLIVQNMTLVRKFGCVVFDVLHTVDLHCTVLYTYS